MLKISENPPILPENFVSIEDMQGTWWVAHTKARFEKAFAWDMLNRDIAYFLPMVKKVRVSGGRKRKTMMPLFSSYVFICGTEQDRYNAMATNRLCQTIEVTDQKQFINELTEIEKAINGDAEISPYPYPAKGAKCRIIAGSLKGLEGIVIQDAKKTRMVLEVNILGQGAAVEIDGDLIESID